MKIKMAKLSEDQIIGDQSPGRLIRRLNKLLQGRIEARFTDATMTYQQWMVLKLVRDGVVETAGELSRELAINTGATTRLIDGLESLDLIARERGARDRRVVGLRLTDAGEKKYAEKIPAMMASWNQVIERFEQTEADQLITMLAKLLNEMERVVALPDRGPAGE